MKKMMKRLLMIVVLVSGSSSMSNADELYHPRFGGEMVKHDKSGLVYEVVRHPKEIMVYPTTDKAETPGEITIKFKNKKGALDRLQLKLIPAKEKVQGDHYYTAAIPAKVYITGGVSFHFK